jgi:endothelin-converting enzyme/putative endopeptidase
MKRCRLLVLLVVAALAAGCGAPSGPGPSGGGEAIEDRLTPAEVARSVAGTFDRSADPCRDFYQYACGGWLKTAEIPADRSSWSRGFTQIAERNLAVLRDILEESAADPKGDPGREKIGRFYGACMDEAAIEKAGLAPVQPLLDRIAAVEGADGLMAVAGHLHGSGLSILFEPVFDADFKNPDVYIAHFLQGGLGLPDRDYYLNDDAESAALRADYVAHVRNMLVLLGEKEDQASRQASAILEFETALARASLPAQDMRNPDRIYHKIDLAGLVRTAPDLPWGVFLEATGYPSLASINVAVPDFFAALSRSAAAAGPDLLRAYLRWRLAGAAADALPAAFIEESFAFYGRRLGGQKELMPRWKRCVNATDEALGEILGHFFVARQFGGDSKEKALEMIRGIERAFEAGLSELAWMDDATRDRAREKIAALGNKIGYPDKWRDYGALQIGPGDHFGNALAAGRFEFRRQADRVGRPVDRTEWGMTPPTVNAYYNPLVNEMVFPAGIMQNPYFHRDFPMVMNFGGMGLAMGHELTHGFDEQGRTFDGSGERTVWWEPVVIGRCEERAQCIADLYDRFEVQPGLRLNGRLTLGENIADFGGLKTAYRAALAWDAGRDGDPPAIEGLTFDQLFFIAFGQTWCTLVTPEMERMLATLDPHSPPRFRVNGPLANFPPFAAAFGCEPGTPMNPVEKCEVW